MLVRSLVALFLSLPAAAGLIGLVLALAPADPELKLPMLLMAFPFWVGVASASYLTTSALRAAIVLSATAAGSFGLLALLRCLGVASI